MCSLTRCLNCGSGGSIAEYRKEETCANRLNFFAHVALPMSVNITAFNIKKMCAKLRKAGKELITLAKSIFIGLFITQYNGNIVTCYQMNEKKAA